MKDIFKDEAPKGKIILCILGGRGDTKISWDEKNPEEIKNAKATFNRLVKEKKFAAFFISRLGRRNKKVTEFDPKLKKLIFIPPMAGGALLGQNYGTAPIVYNPPAENLPFQLKEEAEIKAMTLLKKKIGEEKFIKLVAVGYIEIQGEYGLYKINDKTVTLERSDKIGDKIRPLSYTLCVNVSTKPRYIPLADKILSLYLSIQNNEDKFIETANFRSVNTEDEFVERDEFNP